MEGLARNWAPANPLDARVPGLARRARTRWQRHGSLPHGMSDPALDFLSLLEEREARLIAWGFVDGAFEQSELEDLAEAYVLNHDETGTLTGSDLVRRLRDRALLV